MTTLIAPTSQRQWRWLRARELSSRGSGRLVATMATGAAIFSMVLVSVLPEGPGVRNYPQLG